MTTDVDVIYRRTPENLESVVRSLAAHRPYLRGAPPGLPFAWDARTLKSGLNFTLTTALLPHSVKVHIFGVDCLCLGLDKLIEVKRAAGRPKDFIRDRLC